MGKITTALAGNDPGFNIVAGFDVIAGASGSFPVYPDPAEFTGDADVVVDFSSPQALGKLLDFGVSKKAALVLCTTGYAPDQLGQIEEASKHVPVFKSANMSLGINLLADLVRRACSVLGDAYDVEIIERHHRRKVDAPSGTALMLADAAASALPYDPENVYERHSNSKPREALEIGISSVRGGTIVGEHEVVFAGLDEVVELKHTAASREVFATGALRAAKYIAAIKNPGIYDMTDLLM